MERHFTREGENLPLIPWNEYPRPHLRRGEWLCLNGEWELSAKGVTASILVPFCPESLLSGFAGSVEYGEEMVYSRRFELPSGWNRDRVLLHFGAVSRKAVVTLNGQEVCRHENGYLPFSADVTDALCPGENELAVRVVNDVSQAYPWGKQKIRRGGMWYTPVSGIWQTVWMEPVPDRYIRELTVRTGAEEAEILAEGADSGILLCEGTEYPLRNGRAIVRPSEPELWSPEHPRLYRFTLRAGEDTVESYFALRTLLVGESGGVPRLLLNGKPYFFHGLLDQGYWSDGLYTPASPECFETDVRSMKALGFNTLRKHIKVEPELYYYACDRLGMAVFQDMVNTGDYSFLRDSALPTVGVTALNDHRLHPDPAERQHFLEAMDETVSRLAFHPCICAWTIFNEGWGQFEADRAYERLRGKDSSRFIDSTSGWFRQEKSDVESLHIYFRPLRMGRQKRPQVISEFGGYALPLPGHRFNPDKVYGYRVFKERETFVKALRDLYEKELLPLAEQGLSAAIYTQVSDVEDETNGLLTYDRRVDKVRPEEFLDISLRLTGGNG